jgi:hypothetical protein
LLTRLGHTSRRHTRKGFLLFRCSKRWNTVYREARTSFGGSLYSRSGIVLYKPFQIEIHSKMLGSRCSPWTWLSSVYTTVEPSCGIVQKSAYWPAALLLATGRTGLHSFQGLSYNCFTCLRSCLFFFAFLLLHGLSPRAIYTDRATAACRRSDCQLLRIEGATW